MMGKVPRVLIIAGSDSGGGAGIQADIKTVTMLGGHAMTAITALTAQNTIGVDAVMPVPTEMVLRQIDVVVSDLGVDAVKIGMIGSSETTRAVAGWLEHSARVPVVFDPVMVASSGAELADADTIAVFERLIAVASLVTPNLPELAALTARTVATALEMEEAGSWLATSTGSAVLAKGGHLEGAALIDLLVEPDGMVTHWRGDRIETRHTHGTGCTLASAIACGLGSGASLTDAIDRARNFVLAAIRAAPGFGQGHGPMGHALGTTPFDSIHRIFKSD
ncbi:bifunctional hydroxymethylpyrimidine kinase/phosphomethylpyrimidine kinase [Sphingosinicella rhizophila]|uniref:hydroxymethylpyrimidine kinase n=1 Tax=Sphingosinicella rhizophila TaxID=3050082 RepID=A0ABU3Q4G1_9SPHN|nr:bifunctional hydroxymethylpyrimidine kinase/phosphomethylpyrimidine kinase [Sphingosinicella sp. GR2756]MDT9598286.1 bifunctional hydroxymethylpyrimidine kinase/phosphomethylpyrimidine kinase [Sphingosinicella sp. GR2756]